MENASKALIYSGEILLGVLLLTLMAFLFHSINNFSDTIDKNIEAKNINEFNEPLEKYNNRTDITAQDIITMGNYAKQYNEKIGDIKITVNANVGKKNIAVHMLKDDKNEQYEFIQEYSTSIDEKTNESKIVYYKCTQITYDEQTGLINAIYLKKI